MCVEAVCESVQILEGVDPLLALSDFPEVGLGLVAVQQLHHKLTFVFKVHPRVRAPLALHHDQLAYS